MTRTTRARWTCLTSALLLSTALGQALAQSEPTEALVPPAFLEGHLVTMDGEPIRGAKVIATPPGAPRWVDSGQAETDNDGHFRIAVDSLEPRDLHGNWFQTFRAQPGTGELWIEAPFRYLTIAAIDPYGQSVQLRAPGRSGNSSEEGCMARLWEAPAFDRAKGKAPLPAMSDEIEPEQTMDGRMTYLVRPEHDYEIDVWSTDRELVQTSIRVHRLAYPLEVEVALGPPVTPARLWIEIGSLRRGLAGLSSLSRTAFEIEVVDPTNGRPIEPAFPSGWDRKDLDQPLELDLPPGRWWIRGVSTPSSSCGNCGPYPPARVSRAVLVSVGAGEVGVATLEFGSAANLRFEVDRHEELVRQLERSAAPTRGRSRSLASKPGVRVVVEPLDGRPSQRVAFDRMVRGSWTDPSSDRSRTIGRITNSAGWAADLHPHAGANRCTAGLTPGDYRVHFLAPGIEIDPIDLQIQSSKTRILEVGWLD